MIVAPFGRELLVLLKTKLPVAHESSLRPRSKDHSLAGWLNFQCLSNCWLIKGRQATAGLLSLPLRRAAQTVARQGRAPYGTSPLRCGGGRGDRRHYGTCGPDTLAPLGTWQPHLLPIPNRYLMPNSND
jgi:hypothetical protein